MKDTLLIETAAQAKLLLKPQRLALLKQLAEPRTCTELAAIFDQTPQQVYYHVKQLEKAGLVEKVEEKRVRGIMEGYYQATARNYWLSPQLVGQIGAPGQAQGQSSLSFLSALAEEIYADVGRLGQQSATGTAVPSLGLSAQIHLPDSSRRAAFMADVQAAFQELATQYGLPPEDSNGEELEGQKFQLALACYPKNTNS